MNKIYIIITMIVSLIGGISGIFALSDRYTTKEEFSNYKLVNQEDILEIKKRMERIEDKLDAILQQRNSKVSGVRN